MTSDQEHKTIQYYYRGKQRTANVVVLTARREGRVYYYFHYKGKPPETLTKVDGVWLLGMLPLTDDVEKIDLWRILATAIDEQIIGE
jgi:hypothetical protein